MTTPTNPADSGSVNPSILVQSESQGLNVGITLTEKNYDLWSSLMEMHIAGRKKIGYIRGTIKAPDEDDPKYEDWYAENQKVKGWLLSSMTQEIMKRYIRLKTAKEIWDALSTAFYDGTDEVRVFTLNKRAFTQTQKGRSLTSYFGELTEIFQELDHRDKVIMTCDKDIKAYKKAVERLRVHIFIAGLDVEFEQVGGEILRKDPVPGLQETYAYIRREADRREAMKGNLEQQEGSAMVARARPPQFFEMARARPQEGSAMVTLARAPQFFEEEEGSAMMTRDSPILNG